MTTPTTPDLPDPTNPCEVCAVLGIECLDCFHERTAEHANPECNGYGRRDIEADWGPL